MLRPEITHAGYLDDDVVLELDAVYEMASFWVTAGSDIGGAAFNVVNDAWSSSSALPLRSTVAGSGLGSIAPSGVVRELGDSWTSFRNERGIGVAIWRFVDHQ